jgi:hypothetical protein
VKKMKKAILAIMVLGLCFGLANAAMAVDITDTTYVTVEVREVHSLLAPADATITMDYEEGSDAYASTPVEGKITYIHNLNEPQKITAYAVADADYSGTDIDITVVVASGVASPGAIVTGGVGVDATSAVDLWTNIPTGTNTSTVTWDATATHANTPVGDYGFTVTFTATDVGL